MKKTRVLVAGGYGAVGREIVKLLAERPYIQPVVGGRNDMKAKSLAAQFDCEWLMVDLENQDSIHSALQNVDIVINCYIRSEDSEITLASSAVENGVHYLDINPFMDYSERIIQLDHAARKSEATVITALGAYPGLGGLLVADAVNHFSRILSADTYFAMGGKLDGLTPLSILGVDYMMSVSPLIWDGNQWSEAGMKGTKEFMGEPFNKTIGFFPGMITYDLKSLPEMMKIDNITFWSGMENSIQGLVFYLGSKLGCGKTEKRAKRFLQLLLFLGRGDKNHSDTVLKLVVDGKVKNALKRRIIELHETEDFLTALIPVLVCEQLIHSHIVKRGAFTGPQVVDTALLVRSLGESNIGYEETWEDLDLS